MTAPTTLTLDDLERALADDRHLGWGFAERRNLTATRPSRRTTRRRSLRLSRAVVRQANALGLTSKFARYACDEATDDRRTATEIVANYLTPAFVRAALEV